jgi:hypothetical protein
MEGSKSVGRINLPRSAQSESESASFMASPISNFVTSSNKLICIDAITTALQAVAIMTANNKPHMHGDVLGSRQRLSGPVSYNHPLPLVFVPCGISRLVPRTANGRCAAPGLSPTICRGGGSPDSKRNCIEVCKNNGRCGHMVHVRSWRRLCIASSDDCFNFWTMHILYRANSRALLLFLTPQCKNDDRRS